MNGWMNKNTIVFRPAAHSALSDYELISGGGSIIMQKAATAILLGVSLVGFTLARSQTTAQTTYLTARMKNLNFDNRLGAIYHQRKSQSASHRINVHIPAVYVYDPSGTLVYAGFDPNQNADFLRKLPQSAKGLQRVDGLLDRGEIFDAIPDFAVARQRVEQAHHYLVFAITNFPSLMQEAQQDNAVRQLGEKSTTANSAASNSRTTSIDVLQLSIDMRPPTGNSPQ